MRGSGRGAAAALLCLAAAVVLAGGAAAQSACASDLALLEAGAYGDSANSVQMRKATGQGSYGFFFPLGGELDPGMWGTCKRVGEEVAHYCFFTDRSQHSVGACPPASCSQDDLTAANVTALAASALRLPQGFEKGFTVDCSAAETSPPWYSWLFVAVLCIMLLLVLAGTLADVQICYKWPYNPRPVQEDKEELLEADYWSDTEKPGFARSLNNDAEEEDVALLGRSESARPEKSGYELMTSSLGEKHPSMAIQLLLSFSAPYNFSRLMSSPPAGQMDVLNGIRVLAMAGVVLGHTYYYLWDTMPFQDLPFIVDVASTLRFQTISACFFAVDTFFWLSGFLVGYLFLKELKAKGIKLLTIPMMYVHRILRLTPTLAFGVFFFWLVTPYWSEGPYWKYYQRYVENKCPNGWYWTLLYMQNLVPYMPTSWNASFCMGWAWYLADDMQYFLLSPLLLLVYHKNKWAGWIMCICLTITCIAINVGITWGYNVQPYGGFEHVAEGPDYNPTDANYAKLIYFPPWTRFSPYIIGFMTAFVLLERGERFRVPLPLRYAIYASSVLVMFVVSYITWTNMHYGWELMQNIIYLGFARTAWTIALAALCLLSIIGYGGAFNYLLSSPIWVPMARLTYSAYIYHLGMLVTSYMGSRTVFVYTTQTILYYFLGHLCNAFGLAFVNFLLVEKPLMNVEALLLLPKKKKS